MGARAVGSQASRASSRVAAGGLVRFLQSSLSLSLLLEIIITILAKEKEKEKKAHFPRDPGN